MRSYSSASPSSRRDSPSKSRRRSPSTKRPAKPAHLGADPRRGALLVAGAHAVEDLDDGGSDLAELGYPEAARLTALSILGSLQRALGDLDRVAAWLRVFGMVNAAPGFNNLPTVINGFSYLILDVYGPDRGAHSRSAVGMAELPFDIPVEIEAEVAIAG